MVDLPRSSKNLFGGENNMKSGKGSGVIVGMIVVIFLIAIIGGFLLFKDKLGLAVEKPGEVVTSDCPDTGKTAIKITLYNGLNDTGAESFDATGYLFREDSGGVWSYISTITDTTNPNDSEDVDEICGASYKLCLVASNSDGGDNSVITGIRSDGTGTAKIDSNGCLVFDAKKSIANIGIVGEQHDVLTFRMFDNVDNRFAYDTGDIEAVTFEADGVNFTDGDNTTNFAVGSGGYLDFCIEMKGASTDEDFADAYTVGLIEAPLGTWDLPTVKFDGTILSNIKDTGLTSYEKNQFSTKEYAYKITGDLGDIVHRFCVYLPAKAGQDPTLDIEVDFATAGNYLSVTGTEVKQGAAKDDSGNSVTYTVMDTIIAVS